MDPRRESFRGANLIAVLGTVGGLFGVFVIHSTAAIVMGWQSGALWTKLVADSYAPEGALFILYHGGLGAAMGVALGFVAKRLFAREVAEREKAASLERQLLQSQKMESVGRLAGGIAHDFNNFLSALTINLHLAEQSTDPGAPSAKYIRDASSIASRAGNLPRQLLAFSRTSPTEARPVDPNALIEGVHKICGRLLGEHIRYAATLRAASHIRVDPGQFEQVLLNLCVNARDAMPSGGELFVDTEDVLLGSGVASVVGVPPGRYVLIRVRDTGVGMKAEVRERIFEPFFTTKGVGKGTGLGLSICYAIVDGAGGRITVASEPGTGTTFSIHLPAHAPEPTAAVVAVAPAPATARQSATVLLVDDQPEVRNALRAVLETRGFRVVTAADGEEALELAASASHRPDIVLTDLIMPRLGGRGLAERLRRDRRDLPVVYMTGYAPGDDAPSDGTILAKPFGADALVQTLDEALGRNAV